MKIFLSIIIGAVIGYITNYIAIRMLFRPYKEIKVFGFKLPFTPGLIPKERKRIAKSIGDTVGTHLLTSETVSEVLCSERFHREVSKWLKLKYKNFKMQNIKIGEFLKKYLGNSYEELKIKIKNQIAKKILLLLEDKNFVDTIKLKINEFIIKTDYNLLLKKALADEKNIELIKKWLIDVLNIAETNENKIRDILPENILDSVKESVIQNKDLIAEYLKGRLKSPVVRTKIAQILYDILQQNIGKFISMLISPEFITQKAIASIEEYLDKNENRRDLAFVINHFIDNISYLEVGTIVNSIGDNNKNILIQEISNTIYNQLNKEVTITTISGLIKHEDKLIDFIFNKVEDFKKTEEFKNILNNSIEKTIEILLNVEIATVLNEVDVEELEGFVESIKFSLDELLKNNVDYFVQLLDISKIVEDRINSFDVEFAERLILEVANKELKAITWLGALLGGLMGLLNPLFEFILK